MYCYICSCIVAFTLYIYFNFVYDCLLSPLLICSFIVVFGFPFTISCIHLFFCVRLCVFLGYSFLLFFYLLLCFFIYVSFVPLKMRFFVIIYSFVFVFFNRSCSLVFYCQVHGLCLLSFFNAFIHLFFVCSFIVAFVDCFIICVHLLMCVFIFCVRIY